MMDKETIQARMDPKHLILEDPQQDAELAGSMAPSDEELKKQVSDASLPEAPKVDPDKPDPRSEKVYTFNLDYKDARGKVWTGKFSNKILSIHERQQVGVMRSMLGAGQPVESLDRMTIELNLIVAHLTYSLASQPFWAENLRSLDDPGLLQAIYEEVDSHESHFLGWGTTQSPS